VTEGYPAPTARKLAAEAGSGQDAEMWSGISPQAPQASQSAGPTGSIKISAAAMANGETKPGGGGGGGNGDDTAGDGAWLAARGDVFGEAGSHAPILGTVAVCMR
jgi:hypothetical protein